MELSIGIENYSLPLCAYVAGFGIASHIYWLDMIDLKKNLYRVLPKVLPNH